MTDSDPFAYLSDGGHFENLGTYELLRRRCHVIIVSDASRDNNRTFMTFAHAASKARVDLGIEIDFEEAAGIYETVKPLGRVNIGKIHYPDADEGILIYLKPEVSGSEPIDIVGYDRAHPAFPHDATSRQWFSEAQFEAYRKLGELSGVAAANAYLDFTGNAAAV